MSFCRWSTLCADGHESDLYIYDSVGGFLAVMVAGKRRAVDPSAPAVPPLVVSKDPGRDFIKNHKAYNNWAARWAPTLEAIPLEHAGSEHEFTDIDDAIVFLKELRTLGFRMPDHVLEPDTYKDCRYG